jgi:hypothetical protein
MQAKKPNLPIQLAAAIFFLATAAFADTAQNSDDEQFPLTTLKAFLRHSETAKAENAYIYDPRLPGLKVIVEYAGKTKPIREDAAEFLRMGFKTRNAEHMAQVYHYEVLVLEQKRKYWLPIQDELLGFFKDELKKGKKFETKLRYLGSGGKTGHTFAMIGFHATDAQELPRSEAISTELAQVAIGDKMAKTIKKLTRRHGEPFHTGSVGYSRVYAYLLDKRYQTQLIVRDAGEGFHDKVYSIQVAGPPNPEFELYKGLHLGDPPSKIKEVMGDYTETPSTDGYIRLNFANPRHSVELKNGVLASFMINDDPYYFAE